MITKNSYIASIDGVLNAVIINGKHNNVANAKIDWEYIISQVNQYILQTNIFGGFRELI